MFTKSDSCKWLHMGVRVYSYVFYIYLFKRQNDQNVEKWGKRERERQNFTLWSWVRPGSSKRPGTLFRSPAYMTGPPHTGLLFASSVHWQEAGSETEAGCRCLNWHLHHKVFPTHLHLFLIPLPITPSMSDSRSAFISIFSISLF